MARAEEVRGGIGDAKHGPVSRVPDVGLAPSRYVFPIHRLVARPEQHPPVREHAHVNGHERQRRDGAELACDRRVHLHGRKGRFGPPGGWSRGRRLYRAGGGHLFRHAEHESHGHRYDGQTSNIESKPGMVLHTGLLKDGFVGCGSSRVKESSDLAEGSFKILNLISIITSTLIRSPPPSIDIGAAVSRRVARDGFTLSLT
jgi:hypothetical protein